MPDRQAEAEVWAAFNKARDICMGDRGHAVTVYDDGGRSFEGTGSLERDELLALLNDCAEEAGGEPPIVSLVDVEISQFYDRELEVYQCLIDHGHEPVPPPTREVYLATWETGPWNPHSVPQEEKRLPVDECPATEVADIDW